MDGKVAIYPCYYTNATLEHKHMVSNTIYFFVCDFVLFAFILFCLPSAPRHLGIDMEQVQVKKEKKKKKKERKRNIYKEHMRMFSKKKELRLWKRNWQCSRLNDYIEN